MLCVSCLNLHNHIMKIIIYSTPRCIYCRKAKEFLDSKNISFEERDVAKDKEVLNEMIKKSGQMGVPVIDIDGKIIVGFNRQEIEKVLESRK